MADLLGIPPEKASWRIWLAISLALDILGMLIRFAAAECLNIAGGDSDREAKDAIRAYQAMGMNPVRVLKDHLSGVGSNSAPPTAPGPMPAYEVGGFVPTTGPAIVHSGEYVLPAEVVQRVTLEKLEELMALARGGNAPPPAPIDPPPPPIAPPTVKAGVGGIKKCMDCGTDYTVKTMWQKYCPPCGAKRRKGVMKGKGGQCVNKALPDVSSV